VPPLLKMSLLAIGGASHIVNVGPALVHPGSGDAVQLFILALMSPLSSVVALSLALSVLVSLCAKLCAIPQSRRAQPALRAVLGNNNISALEARTLLTTAALTLVAYAAASAGVDDLVDSALLVVLALVLITLASSVVSLALLLLYSVSAASGGEVWRKAILADTLNVFLCALRVALC
jgi:hypothetical protein